MSLRTMAWWVLSLHSAHICEGRELSTIATNVVWSSVISVDVAFYDRLLDHTVRWGLTAEAGWRVQCSRVLVWPERIEEIA